MHVSGAMRLARTSPASAPASTWEISVSFGNALDSMARVAGSTRANNAAPGLTPPQDPTMGACARWDKKEWRHSRAVAAYMLEPMAMAPTAQGSEKCINLSRLRLSP